MSIRHGAVSSLFGDYTMTGFDEMFVGTGQVRPHYAALLERLALLGPAELERRRRAADLLMRHQGITFTVYGRDQRWSGSFRSIRSLG